MQPLTDGQLRALRLLAQKLGGAATPFLNIADAQFLTEAGLARRSRQGWDITPAGSAYLAGLDPPQAADASVSELHPPRGGGRKA
jgi:hypothetical protein